MLKGRKLSEIYLYLTIVNLVIIATWLLVMPPESESMQLMPFVAMIAEVVLVYKLKSHNEYFKGAFVLSIINSIVSILMPYLAFSSAIVLIYVSIFVSFIDLSIVSIFVIIALLAIVCSGVIIELASAYFKFRGHSGILMDIDDRLAAMWKKLFIFHMIVTIVIVVYIVAFFLFSTDAFFDSLFYAIEPDPSVTSYSQIIMIVLLAIKCIETFYLYKTHKAFVRHEEN